MTHEELLAKIDSKLEFCTCDGWNNNCWEDDNKPWIILRAVVELHKRSGGWFCDACTKPSDEVFYPCPTIQAIEEAVQL